MPRSRQASRIVVPAGTDTEAPSIVSATDGTGWTGGGPGGTDALAGEDIRMADRISGSEVAPWVG